jgi:hypothetical protein
MRFILGLSLLMLLPTMGCEDEDFVPKALLDAAPEMSDALSDARSEAAAAETGPVEDAGVDAPVVPMDARKD